MCFHRDGGKDRIRHGMGKGGKKGREDKRRLFHVF